MFQDTVASWRSRSGGTVRASDAPEVAVRLVGSLLALAIAAVHVADQGGVTSLASPAWIGWSYRLIEAGAVLTALILLVGRPPWLGWAASVLLGVGPFVAYITSRTVGLPGDSGDIGNWGYWVGTVSLAVEAALVVLSIGMLLAWRQRWKAAAATAAAG